jgi:methyl-accepting chemotaxis protein
METTLHELPSGSEGFSPSVREESLDATWIREATRVLDAASKGDFEARLTGHAHFGPELEQLSILINRTLDVVDGFVREAGAALASASRGEFYRRVVLRGMPGAFRNAAILINAAEDDMAAQAHSLQQAEEMRLGLAEEFEGTLQGVVEGVVSSSLEMKATAQSMSAHASEALERVEVVVRESESTASNVRGVAAATEQLTSSIGEIGRQVDESTHIAASAVAEGKAATTTVNKLLEASQRIDGVVRLISQIAKKTNLLALNATIEAARAGEAGKGFAVVAGEVKDLAQQTAKATEEVNAEIREIQETTGNVAGAIGNIGETIQRMSKSSEAISCSVNEQRGATAEISRNITEAAHATERVQDTIAALSVAAQATSQGSEQVLSGSGSLAQQAAALDQTAKKFLSDIRMK